MIDWGGEEKSIFFRNAAFLGSALTLPTFGESERRSKECPTFNIGRD